jgi:flagellar biosynthetic protein FliR
VNELAVSILAQLQLFLVVGFLVFLRVGAAIAVLPAFGERSIPTRLRLCLALAFSSIVAPAVAPQVQESIRSQETIWLLLVSETSVGLVLGLCLRFFILCLQIAGTIAAQSTSLSQIFGTAAMEPLPAMGHLMVVGGLALLAISGFHVHVAVALVSTYSVFPPGLFPSANLLAEWGTQRVSATFSLAFVLAAPFVIASVIYNLALGIINKAMPQLMVAFVGAPAITLGGLVLLFLTMPALMAAWQTQFSIFLADPFVVE